MQTTPINVGVVFCLFSCFYVLDSSISAQNDKKLQDKFTLIRLKNFQKYDIISL